MCVLRCSNVGLISVVVMAHTSPALMLLFRATSRANASLSTIALEDNRQALRLERFYRAIPQPLAQSLYLLEVVLEQNLVLQEVLLHARRHKSLQIRRS